MNVSGKSIFLKKPYTIQCLEFFKAFNQLSQNVSFCRTGPLRKTKNLDVSLFTGGKQNSQNQAEKPFHCNVCDGTFSRYSSLWSHKRLHSGDKPFKCEVCGLAFAKGE